MQEWFNWHAWKACDSSKAGRGFESPSLRQKQKITPPSWRFFCFLTMAVMPWYEQTAEENNIILGNAQDDFLLLKHHHRGSRAKRVIPSLRNTFMNPATGYRPQSWGILSLLALEMSSFNNPGSATAPERWHPVCPV